MDVLYDFLIGPFVEMVSEPVFFAEVVIGGLMSGVMYSLVALGFAVIFKASGVVNFAQGAMVLFSALTLVGLMEYGLPTWLAIAATIVIMTALAYVIERMMLRRLVNQPHIVLFMATIGLAFVFEGFGEMLWGADVKKLDLGIPDQPFFVGGMLLNQFEIVATIVAALLVGALIVFLQTTTMGRALRAVADDNQAALSVGIPLTSVWVVVWSVAGFIALVAGIMWGAQLGVQFSLSLIAFKALPVLILGGFNSIPGAIVAGLIIGVGEKVGEVYWGPVVGGAIENWFAYVLAMVVLLFRPQGLFGEKIIERV